jgi:hypothetical protein
MMTKACAHGMVVGQGQVNDGLMAGRRQFAQAAPAPLVRCSVGAPDGAFTTPMSFM